MVLKLMEYQICEVRDAVSDYAMRADGRGYLTEREALAELIHRIMLTINETVPRIDIRELLDLDLKITEKRLDNALQSN